MAWHLSPDGGQAGGERARRNEIMIMVSLYAIQNRMSIACFCTKFHLRIASRNVYVQTRRYREEG